MKLFGLLFGAQFAVYIVVLFLGFSTIVPEEIIFNYYFVLYEPLLSFLTRGSGFVGLLIVLPLIVLLYSGVLASLILLFRSKIKRLE